MILLVSMIFSVLICGAVIGVLLWVKTPHYRVDHQQVIRLLEWMILGQASENDWRVFCDYPIRHNEQLESVRQQCLHIDEASFIGSTRSEYLLNQEGLAQLRDLLDTLNTEPRE